MAILEIKMGSLGIALDVVTVTKIYSKEGDNVTKGEPIIAVESSKVSFEIYAPEEGMIKEIKVKEGETVNVGDIVATLETGKDGSGIKGNKSQADQRVGIDKKLDNQRKFIYPAAKKLIKEYNLDVSKLEGTGPRGVIRRKDILELLEKTKETKELFYSESKEFGKRDEEIIPFIGTRKVIAEHMVRSLKVAAHVTTSIEIDMTLVLELRKKLNKDFEEFSPYKISPIAFIVKAISAAINEFPIMNSTLDMENENIIIKKYINLSYAVETEHGLLVPVIRNIENMNLLKINTELHKITNDALNGKLKPPDMSGGTITISNAGANGAVTSTPIINQPQNSIIWIGVIAKKPAVINEEIIPRDLMNLCISYDHRVIDGAIVARFAQKIKKELEQPFKKIFQI